MQKNLKIWFCVGKTQATIGKVLPAQVLISLAHVYDYNSAQLPLTPLVNDTKGQNIQIKQQILVAAKIHRSYHCRYKIGIYFWR